MNGRSQPQMSKRLQSGLPSRSSKHAIIVLSVVVIAHLANAAISAWFGYLSPDSWTYLRLAKGFQTHFYPTLDHSYFAVFPFGYPLLLALASPGLDLVHGAIVSKFVNAALWIASYVFLMRLRVPALPAAALVITPFALSISAMTWSENLMIFASVLTLAAIDAIQNTEGRAWRVGGFAIAALIVGISSRYAFGFIAASFLAAYVAAFRYDSRRNVVLVLIIAGALFALYLALNTWLTGHGTGMDRGPATDPLAYQAFTFATANIDLVFSVTLPFAFVTLIATRDWRIRPLALMIGLVGVSYIAIMTILRLRNHFDPFDERLLGPGWLMIAIAVALTAGESSSIARQRVGVAALILLAFWSTYAAHGEDTIELVKNGQMTTSLVSSIGTYMTAFESEDDDADSVITVEAPSPRPTVHGDNRLYYGDLDVFEPMSAPLSPRETLEAFSNRIRNSKTDLRHCAVDFSHFASEDEMSDILDDVYAASPFRDEPVFDPAVAERFHSTFSPRSLVPCSVFLDGTSAPR